MAVKGVFTLTMTCERAGCTTPEAQFHGAAFVQAARAARAAKWTVRRLWSGDLHAWCPLHKPKKATKNFGSGSADDHERRSVGGGFRKKTSIL